ncbi:hypothetical protein EDEG_01702 [Edhazardia aedis USNM 41457]|uniref:Chromatin-remodeling ATPase INO80 n=1 Tax=Edhazardia aedis (strain USNM 41457) TaxID=1003232 RepID=J8ZWD7_EDHAE|nr:hypothetical protein EDEG_01702 [Edhazardia aedis USNM 41457]|eukprot:EJW04008.1 hypothetical protein EDEG_01702 [Edhazardia aedis USNM 41457]
MRNTPPVHKLTEQVGLESDIPVNFKHIQNLKVYLEENDIELVKHLRNFKISKDSLEEKCHSRSENLDEASVCDFEGSGLVVSKSVDGNLSNHGLKSADESGFIKSSSQQFFANSSGCEDEKNVEILKNEKNSSDTYKMRDSKSLINKKNYQDENKLSDDKCLKDEKSRNNKVERDDKKTKKKEDYREMGILKDEESSTVENSSFLEKDSESEVETASGANKYLEKEGVIMKFPTLKQSIWFCKDVKSLLLLKKVVNNVFQPSYEDFSTQINAQYANVVKNVVRQYKIIKSYKAILVQNHKKISICCARELRRALSKTSKTNPIFKAKKIGRELGIYFKKEERKKVPVKPNLKALRKETEEKEELRAKRKLNFLINQTELFSHFMAKKGVVKEDILDKKKLENSQMCVNSQESNNADSQNLNFTQSSEFNAIKSSGEAANSENTVCASSLNIESKNDRKVNKDELFEDDKKDFEYAKQMAMEASLKQRDFIQSFGEAHHKKQKTATPPNQKSNNTAENSDDTGSKEKKTDSTEENTGENAERTVQQPKILNATLKPYQLQGLNWLVKLYDQGINGILADDMGLGKTIQSISFLAHLYEKEDIQGPFLIITPASTLHNWLSEIERFVPSFKAILYAGSISERKILRKSILTTNVTVTSYQIVVSDFKIFKRYRFQYMILDEAQAIKSFTSNRWQTLLNISCRNRLLLTGTPIQNTMAELWALLHFIMPTLFDNLEDFSLWFSKDIENKKINNLQLNRLHAILKPFMLRRVKDDVKDELGIKIEKNIFCDMSNRQKKLYEKIQSQKNNKLDTIENFDDSENAKINEENLESDIRRENIYADNRKERLLKDTEIDDEYFKDSLGFAHSESAKFDISQDTSYTENSRKKVKLTVDSMEISETQKESFKETQYENTECQSQSENTESQNVSLANSQNTASQSTNIISKRGKLLAQKDYKDTEEMMNLMMQFRKVCNHPDLFEKEEVNSGFCFNINDQRKNDYYENKNKISFFIGKKIGDFLVQNTMKTNFVVYFSNFFYNIDVTCNLCKKFATQKNNLIEKNLKSNHYLHKKININDKNKILEDKNFHNSKRIKLSSEENKKF